MSRKGKVRKSKRADQQKKLENRALYQKYFDKMTEEHLLLQTNGQTNLYKVSDCSKGGDIGKFMLVEV